MEVKRGQYDHHLDSSCFGAKEVWILQNSSRKCFRLIFTFETEPEIFTTDLLSLLLLLLLPANRLFFCFLNFIIAESEVTQSCPTFCDPMDRNLPGSSVHGIFQAKVLEWVAISFSRGSFQPSNRTRVSCIAGRMLYHLSHQGSLLIITETCSKASTENRLRLQNGLGQKWLLLCQKARSEIKKKKLDLVLSPGSPYPISLHSQHFIYSCIHFLNFKIV